MKFDTEGHFLGEWGELGQAPGQMEQTFGIAIHPLGYAYITQRLPYRVHKFDLDGDFIMRWGRDEEITAATGIAITSRDEVVVADHFGGQMQTFDLDGRLLATWAEGELLYPAMVAVDERDRVYVADAAHSQSRIYERVWRCASFRKRTR